MQVPRLLIPGVVFVGAVGLLGVTFLGGDDTALVDTSDIEVSPGSVTDTASTATVPTSTADVASAAAATTVVAESASGPTDPAPTTSAPAQSQPSTAMMAPLQVTNEAMAIGDPDAPLVMVTFESFGCAWCGHFHDLTMPQIVDDWVDAGRLRVESRMMPYEERAVPGALAGVAAGMQGKFWELADVMYPYISGGEPPNFEGSPSAEWMSAYHDRQSEASMLVQVEAVADDIGLDYERFLADFHSDEAQAIMEADTQLAYAIGFTGTPAMVVNGVPVGGFMTHDSFDQFLTNVLAASDG